MNRFASTSFKALLAAILFATFLAAGSADVSAQRRGGGLDICPDGWRPVTQPLNPLLICLPDTLVLEQPGSEAPPTGGCPEGWEQATHPLNPVLGCLPDTIVPAAAPKQRSRGNGGICPDGWRPATQPLNPVLGCLPDNLHLSLGGLEQGLPPGGCPEGWIQATPPLNPLLVCLPNTIKENGGGNPRGR